MPNTQSMLQGKVKPAKIFKGAIEPQPPPTPGSYSRNPNMGPRHITGLSFDDRGDQVVTAAEDETFRLYNCKTGKRVLLSPPTASSTELALQAPEDAIFKKIWS